MSRVRDMGKGAGRDVCGHVQASGLSSDNRTQRSGRVYQGGSIAQSKGELL
jgi:hypothetical protein